MSVVEQARPWRPGRRPLHDLPGGIGAGAAFLMERGRAGFPDAAHAITFPRIKGFHAPRAELSSDVFSRLVVAGALLDTAALVRAWEERAGGEGGASGGALGGELGGDPGGIEALARAQLEHALGRRIPDLRGGFAYFPELEELPPDADSLAAIAALVARLNPERWGMLAAPMALALEGFEAQGYVPTWLIDEGDPPARREAMVRGVRHYWGDGLDVGVNARFIAALVAGDPGRAAWAAQAAAPLLAAQGPEGLWRASWYCGEIVPTCMVMDTLETVGVGEAARARGARSLWALQRPDGGWGEGRSDALPTGAALHALCPLAGEEDAPRIARGVHRLLGMQERDGSFDGSPWMKMDIGRAWGRVIRSMSFGCESVSTAMAIRGLAAALGRSQTQGAALVPESN